MRDCGVQVGLGSHIPEVIEYAEERGWNVDFYMTCFYNLSRDERESALVSGDRAAATRERFLEEDPPRMAQTIQATPKTCLAFKILAASRHCGSQAEVAEAFRFAFEQIKPTDAVVVGMYQKHLDQVSLNVEHVRAALANGQRRTADIAAGETGVRLKIRTRRRHRRCPRRQANPFPTDGPGAPAAGGSGVSAATILTCPPHRSHTLSSNWNTRASHTAQASLCRRCAGVVSPSLPPASPASAGFGPGTICARSAAWGASTP